MPTSKHLFTTRDPEKAIVLFRSAAPGAVESLGDSLPKALQGNVAAIRTYVSTYSSALERVLLLAHQHYPDLVRQTEDRLVVIDAKGEPAPYAMEALKTSVLSAPFSSWVSAYGPGSGTVLELLSRVRSSLKGSRPLSASKAAAGLPHWKLQPEDFQRFKKAATLELDRQKPPLQRIADVFDLSMTELGRLFGVTRQAVAGWMERGVPSARQPKVHTILELCELLERNLRRESISAIARKRASAYGGRSMLEMIATDRHEQLLEKTRASFDWAATA